MIKTPETPDEWIPLACCERCGRTEGAALRRDREVLCPTCDAALGGILEGLRAIYKAGGSAWDEIDDPRRASESESETKN